MLSVTGLRDAAGNAQAVPFTRSYTTGASSDLLAPAIVNQVPDHGATGVATGTTVTVTFGERIDAVTVDGNSFVLQDSTTGMFIPAGVVVAGDGLSAILTPAAALAPARTCTASVDCFSNARDLAGNPVGYGAWSFTTQ